MSIISKFTINEKNENLSVYWGEIITVEWEIAKQEGGQLKKGSQEFATLYPYGWKLTERKGRMDIPVYEGMELILRAKGDDGKSEQQSLTAAVKEGKASAELTIMLQSPRNEKEPYASLLIDYKNAAYGYLNRGVGRVEGTEVSLYADSAGKIYRFITPYIEAKAASVSAQEFELWKE